MNGKRVDLRVVPYGLRPRRVRNPLRMLLINGCTMPYPSAEIPPAGAPSGFDSAAIIHFIA